MSKEELKQKLHRLIDEMEDEQALNMLYEDAVDFKTSADVDDELTDEQWTEIQEAMKEVERGETYTLEQVMQHYQKWLDTK